MAQERKSIMEVIKPPQFIDRRKEPKLPQSKPLDEFQDDMRKIAEAEAAIKQAGRTGSANMEKVQKLLNDGVAHAYEDSCKALDLVRDECHQVIKRIDEAVENEKQRLMEESARMTSFLGGGLLELRNTMEWVEQQCPKLREPAIPSLPTGSPVELSPAPSSADFEPSDYEDNPQP